MASGTFITYPENELLNMRDRITQAILDVSLGDKAFVVSLGGKSYTFTQANMVTLRELLSEVNYALQRTNPTAHGKRVTHTYPNWQVIDPTYK